MRRSLIVTTGAAVAMVLIAMLVPMAVLAQNYALEDRLAQAALEVQATETVVSGQDQGEVAVCLDRVNNADTGIVTTVLYPDGSSIGPSPGEDARVVQARQTGRARVDESEDGAELLVPVALGPNSPLPESTPVVRVEVSEPGLGSGVVRAWLILLGLGVVLWVGALVLADRLGRSFVRPIAALAQRAEALSDPRQPAGSMPVEGPPEVRALASAINRLVGRIEVLLERERRGVSDLSHRLRTPITAMRLRVEQLSDPAEGARLSADLDELEAMVDHVVTQARRSEREGLVARCEAVSVVRERAAFWEPLAEDQGRSFDVTLPDHPVPVATSEGDLAALLDALLDNVFFHTPEGVPIAITLEPDDDRLLLVVQDGGAGFPADVDVTGRGVSGGSSTGLGLSIVAATAAASGGSLRLGRSTSLGGARAEVRLGPPS